MYLLHENRCRPCDLSRSTARDDSLNHCPIGPLSTSPLNIQTNENCVKFSRTNISKSPIISRTHLPFFWSLTRLPHILHQIPNVFLRSVTGYFTDQATNRGEIIVDNTV